MAFWFWWEVKQFVLWKPLAVLFETTCLFNNSRDPSCIQALFCVKFLADIGGRKVESPVYKKFLKSTCWLVNATYWVGCVLWRLGWNESTLNLLAFLFKMFYFLPAPVKWPKSVLYKWSMMGPLRAPYGCSRASVSLAHCSRTFSFQCLPKKVLSYPVAGWAVVGSGASQESLCTYCKCTLCALRLL